MNPKQEIERLMEENRKLRIIAEMVLQFDLNGDIGDSLLFEPSEPGKLSDYADWDEAWSWFYESRQKEKATNRGLNDSSPLFPVEPTGEHIEEDTGHLTHAQHEEMRAASLRRLDDLYGEVNKTEVRCWIVFALGALGMTARRTNARLHAIDLMVQDAHDLTPPWETEARQRLWAMSYLLGFAKREHVMAAEKQPMIWMFIDLAEEIVKEEQPEESIQPEYVPTVGEMPF